MSYYNNHERRPFTRDTWQIVYAEDLRKGRTGTRAYLMLRYDLTYELWEKDYEEYMRRWEKVRRYHKGADLG